jgi:hypothetical protein
MLWTFATAVLTGLLCGCLFRVPALTVLSFLGFGGAIVLSLAGHDTLGSALITAIALTATLQLGYLLGAGLCYLLQQFRGQLGNGLTLGFEVPRVATSQAFAPVRRARRPLPRTL